MFDACNENKHLFYQKNSSIVIRVDSLKNLHVKKTIKNSNHENTYIFDHVFSDLLINMPGLINWKDEKLFFRGCTKENATLLGLESPQNIIGKNDDELVWSNNGYAEFFKEEDLQVLSGKIMLILGKYNFHDKSRVLLVKKLPVLNMKKSYVIGIINYLVEFVNLASLINYFSYMKILLTIELINKIKVDFFTEKKSVIFNKREEECLYYLIKGLSLKEIGKQLGISFRTVESYVNFIKNKLECRKTSSVVIKAIELGYLNNVPVSILFDKTNKNIS